MRVNCRLSEVSRVGPTPSVTAGPRVGYWYGWDLRACGAARWDWTASFVPIAVPSDALPILPSSSI